MKPLSTAHPTSTAACGMARLTSYKCLFLYAKEKAVPIAQLQELSPALCPHSPPCPPQQGTPRHQQQSLPQLWPEPPGAGQGEVQRRRVPRARARVSPTTGMGSPGRALHASPPVHSQPKGQALPSSSPSLSYRSPCTRLLAMAPGQGHCPKAFPALPGLFPATPQVGVRTWNGHPEIPPGRSFLSPFFQPTLPAVPTYTHPTPSPWHGSTFPPSAPSTSHCGSCCG